MIIKNEKLRTTVLVCCGAIILTTAVESIFYLAGITTTVSEIPANKIGGIVEIANKAIEILFIFGIGISVCFFGYLLKEFIENQVDKLKPNSQVQNTQAPLTPEEHNKIQFAELTLRFNDLDKTVDRESDDYKTQKTELERQLEAYKVILSPPQVVAVTS